MHSKNLFDKKIRVLTPLAITPALPFVVGAWPSVRGVKVSDGRLTKMSWCTAAGQQARGARVERSTSAYPYWAQGISSRGQETNGEAPRWNYRKVINGHARKIHMWCQGDHDVHTKCLRQRPHLEAKHIYRLWFVKSNQMYWSHTVHMFSRCYCGCSEMLVFQAPTVQ